MVLPLSKPTKVSVNIVSCFTTEQQGEPSTPRGMTSRENQMTSRDNGTSSDSFGKIEEELSQLKRNVHQIRQKQRSIRTMMDRYNRHDYDFCAVMERAKRLTDSKLRDTERAESGEFQQFSTSRLKFPSSGSSSSCKSSPSFFEELAELGEQDPFEISEISNISDRANSMNDSSVFESY